MFRRIICKIERHILGCTQSKPNFLVFESDEHHVFDNSFYLFQHCLKYKKLKCFYVVYNKSQYKEALKKGIKRKRVIFLTNRINLHRLKNASYIIRNKIILRKCSLCFISYRNFFKEFKIKFYNDQTLINLRHGEFPIKNVTSYYKGLLFDYDANIYFRVGTKKSLSFLPNELKELKCNWFASPMPRNDFLFSDKHKNFEKLIQKTFVNNQTRFILCMTTFRKDARTSYLSSQFPLKLKESEFFELNENLKKNNVIFIIKVHHDNIIHKEDNDKIKYSNIMLLADEDFEKNDLFVNDILQYCDMLVTDYSSVLFDFLFYDKPISFITTDIDDYLTSRGLYNLEFLSIGHCIKTNIDLISEIDNLVKGFDDKSEERKKFHLLFNKENEEAGCERLLRLFVKQNLLN